MAEQSHKGYYSNNKIFKNDWLKNGVRIRTMVQMSFFLVTLFIGIRFYWFVTQLEAGAVPSVVRPPGVEAFLPISALVSLKYFLFTGVFNLVHPSALVIFLIVCTTALVFKKGFCAWVCPIGFLSDLLSRFHRFLFKKRLSLPRGIDRGLRLVKYLLAGFFVWSIFFNMPVNALEQFIYSPYNRFADVKMLEFFTHISRTALVVTFVLSMLSVVIPYFWCRYLCPYGALLSLLGLLSLGRIRRNQKACIKCGKCEAVCPGRIQIMDRSQVHSMECSACLRCVDACPETDALGFALVRRLPVTSKGIALAMVALFALGITVARQTGYWRNNTPVAEYRSYLIGKQVPEAPIKGMDPEKMKRMKEMMRQMQARESASG